MPFRVSLRSNEPQLGRRDSEQLILWFLQQTGYLADGFVPRDGRPSVFESVPFRLFYECLWQERRAWDTEELLEVLGTTRVSLFNHLYKLVDSGLVAEERAQGGNPRRYFLRGGDLAMAWRSTQAMVDTLMLSLQNVVPSAEATTTDDGVAFPSASSSLGLRLIEQIPTEDHNPESRPFPWILATLGVSSQRRPLTSRLLGLLTEAGGGGWTTQEMAQMADLTPSQVNRQCQLLEHIGLLERWTPSRALIAAVDDRWDDDTVLEGFPDRSEVLAGDAGLLQRALRGLGGRQPLGYRLRGGSLSRALSSLRTQLQYSADNYGQTLQHLERQRKAALAAK